MIDDAADVLARLDAEADTLRAASEGQADLEAAARSKLAAAEAALAQSESRSRRCRRSAPRWSPPAPRSNVRSREETRRIARLEAELEKVGAEQAKLRADARRRRRRDPLAAAFEAAREAAAAHEAEVANAEARHRDAAGRRDRKSARRSPRPNARRKRSRPQVQHADEAADAPGPASPGRPSPRRSASRKATRPRSAPRSATISTPRPTLPRRRIGCIPTPRRIPPCPRACGRCRTSSRPRSP